MRARTLLRQARGLRALALPQAAFCVGIDRDALLCMCGRRQQALGMASPLGRLRVMPALLHLARQEGVSGMFKGLPLNLIKNPIATSVSFTVNDVVKDSLKRERQSPPP